MNDDVRSLPESTQATEDGSDDLDEFLAEYCGEGFQFSIRRLEPKVATIKGQTKRVSGHLKTVHEMPTPDQIREEFGGGLYQIRVTGPKNGRKNVYRASRRLEIAGDPILKETTLPTPDPIAVPAVEAPRLVEKLVEVTVDDKRRSDERLERLTTARESAADPTLIQTAVQTIREAAKEQVETMRQQLAQAAQRTSPLENPEFVKALFGRNGEESARVAESYRRDLDQERERSARDLQAERERREREQRDFAIERERYEREMKAMREQHQRDLDQERRDRDSALQTIDRLNRSEVENLRTLHAQLLASKEEQIARLGDEVRQLRDKAQPHDTLEDLQRMQQVVSAVKSFIPGERDDETPSDWKEMAVELGKPLVEKFADTFARAQAAQAAQQARINASRRPMPVPTPQPIRVPAWPTAPMPQARPVVAAAKPVPAPTMPAANQPAMTEAISLLESALENGTSPTDVARSALSLLGRGPAAALVATGHEALHAQIVKTVPDSHLASLGGKHFLRELVAALKKEVATRNPETTK